MTSNNTSGAVFNNRNDLISAVSAWFADKEQASNTYGDISTWDVGAVTDMRSLFAYRPDSPFTEKFIIVVPCELIAFVRIV